MVMVILAGAWPENNVILVHLKEKRGLYIQGRANEPET